MQSYQRGQDAVIRADFRDRCRALDDPEEVTISVVAPSGAETDLTVTSIAVGRYTATFATASAEEGVHVAIVTGSGGLVAAGREEFLVVDLPEE